MFGSANSHPPRSAKGEPSVTTMDEEPGQIAVVARERGEILEAGDRTAISPREADTVYVEIQCENCGEAGTYRGDIVPEGDERFRSHFDANCTTCGNHLEATVNLQEDSTGGGMNVVDFQPPEGGTYNHDPYFANKIDEVDEEGTPTGPPS
jgi:ribosomal protein S27E